MNPKAESIHTVLSKNSASFFIPPFQRAYAWGDQEIDRYFEDIKRIIESERDSSIKDKQEHFFGVLVFKTENDGFASREVVVDGQQRLTTTLLLLIALRDVETDNNKRTQINDMFLINPSSTFSEKIKLKQVTEDWDAYKALVMGDKQISGKITNGYKRFLAKLGASGFTTEEYVKALTKINVVCIFLDERPYKGEDPQIIFETLNSLGKPLSLADLIRNYILLEMASDDQSTIFESKWHPEIEEKLREKSSQFFRDYLQNKEGKYFKVVNNDTNTKELYSFFKDYVDRVFREDKIGFISDICRYAPLYQWIIEVNPKATISVNSEKNNRIIELLRNIFHDIKADAFKPLVLVILEYHQFGFDNIKLSDDQMIEALVIIRTYLCRRRVLKLTQGENKEIPRLCSYIRRNKALLTDARSEMLRLLSRGAYRLRIPNNTEISDELKRIDFYNGLSKYSKFILGKIEEHISKVSVDFRDKRITIEHIMPQAIKNNEDWKAELGEDWKKIYKTYLHNIGNLVLTEFNMEIGNKSLQFKKERLNKSNLQYRLDVLERKTWNLDDIIAHRKEMIDRFVAVFSLPISMQNADNWETRNPDNS